MMTDEKDQLMALLEDPKKWCRNAEAVDVNGNAVHYDDPAAVAWDVTGALCRLFGWPRACVLFGQFHRRIHGKPAKSGWPPRDTEMDAMAALQDFNDSDDTNIESLRARIESIPVWRATSGTVRSEGTVADLTSEFVPYGGDEHPASTTPGAGAVLLVPPNVG